MSKFSHVLLLTAIALANQGVPSATYKIETAARSENTDEWIKLASQNVGFSNIPAGPNTLPNIAFPPIPTMASLNKLDEENKMDPNTNFSTVFNSSSSFKTSSFVYTNDNGEIKQFHVENNFPVVKNVTTEATNKATSVQTIFYVYFSFFISVWSYLYSHV